MRLTGKTEDGRYGFITEHETLGVFDKDSNANKRLEKLGKLEDIEEELGIDLITVANIFKSLQKMYDCSYLRECYGEIIACNTGNYGVPYPLTEKETKYFLIHLAKKELECDKRAKYSDNANIIEKELKALEIIKDKKVDIQMLRDCILFDYNRFICLERKPLTQEEYDLLKEVLANEEIAKTPKTKQ